jgi:ribosomal protein S21
VVEVKRKKGESFEALLRRFSRRIQQSGRILQAKKVRFYHGDKNATATKAAALRRNEISVRREYLLKTGKLKEERGFGKRSPRG